MASPTTNCELCGKKAASLRAEIEGTMMAVCADCSRFGSVKGKTNVRIVIKDTKPAEEELPSYIFVDGYGKIVKDAREKLGLSQEDFAKKISEHKSLIHQVESEHLKPNMDFARKLERALKIKIFDEVKNDKITSTVKVGKSREKAEGLTFGDFIKNRK